MTNLYMIEFGDVAEKQRKDILPSMETHCVRICYHKIAPAVWTFEASLKKKQSVSFLSTSISFTFFQNWSIIYVTSFFPPPLMCEVQSTIDATVGGAFPHRTRTSKEASALLYPHLLTTQDQKQIKLKILTSIFFLLGGLNSPPTSCACYNIYLNLVDPILGQQCSHNARNQLLPIPAGHCCSL